MREFGWREYIMLGAKEKSKSPQSTEILNKQSAPVRCLIYSRCKSYPVKSNQQLVLSLGVEMVTLDLSVGKGVCEP